MILKNVLSAVKWSCTEQTSGEGLLSCNEARVWIQSLGL